MRKRNVSRSSRPSKYITGKQLAEYKLNKQILERQKYLNQLKVSREAIKNYRSQRRYDNTRTGKFASRLGSVMTTAGTSGGVTNFLYRKQMPLQNPYSRSESNRRTIIGKKHNLKGRPRGTYDTRYAQYGGVYGYRKMMANQLRIQRLEAMRRSTVSPAQEQVIRRIEAQQQMQRQSPESRPIPDTYGAVYLDGINSEIDEASNMFG